MSCTGHLAAPEDLFNCFPVFQTCHAECCSFQQHASPPPSLRMLYRCWQRARCPANGATSEFSPRRVSYSIPLSNFLVFSRPFVVLPSHRDSHFLRHQPRRGGYEKAGLQSVSSYLNGQRTRSAPGYHWVQRVIGPKGTWARHLPGRDRRSRARIALRTFRKGSAHDSRSQIRIQKAR